MKLRKDKLVKAIDNILAESAKRQAAWDAAVEKWHVERRENWLRDELPKFVKARDLISKRSKARQPVTYADLIGVFGTGSSRYQSGYDSPTWTPFIEDPSLPISIELKNGRKYSRPTGINVNQMKAMKELLNAIEDEVVSDTTLSRLGVKDVTPIFQAAVMQGALVE